MSKHIKKIKPAAKPPEHSIRIIRPTISCPPEGGGN
jgi:hypothetical protein